MVVKNFTATKSDSASFGPFSASYSVALHLQDGTLQLNDDNTIEVQDMEIVFDTLKVQICFNLPGFCIPSFCIVPNPWNGCLVGFQGFCIGGPICASLDLSGLVSEVKDLKARLKPQYFVDPGRNPMWTDLDAELNGKSNQWKIFIDPRLDLLDKLFWVAVRRFWPGWRQALIVVTPETVVRWHRAGFCLYWTLVSKARKPIGRRQTSKEVRELIFQMVAENRTWGAPGIHGELLMLGFDVSERTISRWIRRAPRDPEPARRWLAFLRNHREAIAAMDFFTVPTITFRVLYCFFIIAHDRRRILRFNATKHPTSMWIVQQLREAFQFELAARFLIFDRDAKYRLEVPAAVRSLKMSPVRTSFESPWQHGVAERWVGSCRRDLLDHIIAINERHLKRLLCKYVSYHHEDRTHLGLGKGTPHGRTHAVASGRVLSHLRLGGLHHRYNRAA